MQEEERAGGPKALLCVIARHTVDTATLCHRWNLDIWNFLKDSVQFTAVSCLIDLESVRSAKNSLHVAVFWRIDKVHLCNMQCQSLHSSNLSSSLCRNVQHFTVCIFMCVFTMCILQKCSFYSVYVTEFCVFYCVLVWFPHLPLSNSSFNPGSQNLGNTAALHHDEDSSDIQ